MRKATGLDLGVLIVAHEAQIGDERRQFALVYVNASRKRSKRRSPSVAGRDFHPRESWGLRRGDIYVRRGDSTDRLSSQAELEDLLSELEAQADEDDLRASGLASPFAVQDGLYRLLEKGYITFIGRRDLREQVLSAVTKDPRIWIVNVHGPGGVGKSALVNWATYQFYKLRSFEAIIQLSAKETALTPSGIQPYGRTLYSLDNLLDHILRTFEEEPHGNIEDKKRIAADYLSAWKTLLVLDNMETLSDGRVLDFLQNLPPKVQAKVLLTSRQKTGGWELPVPVRELGLEETTDFLRTKSAEMDADFPLGSSVCARVHEISGGLPLAIQWIIGRFKIDRDTKIVLERVRSRESPVLEFSFRNIWDGLSSDAQSVLGAMTIFDKPPTAQQLVVATEWPLERIERATADLADVTLLNRTTQQADGRIVYVALPITLSFAGHQLATMGSFESACRKRVNSFTEQLVLQESEVERFTSDFKRYGLESPNERKAATLCRLGQSEMFSGNTDAADTRFKQAQDFAPHSAYVYAMSASYKLARNRTAEALEFAKQACKLADRRTGGLAHYILAQVLRVNRDKRGRVEALKKAVEYEPNNVIYRHQLGVALSINGKTEDAIDVFTHIIDTEVKRKQPREALIMSLKTRIINLRRLGRFDEAWQDLALAEKLMQEHPYLKAQEDHIAELREKGE